MLIFPFPFQGRFTIAAKHHITIAEVYESELVDIEKVSKCRERPVHFSVTLHFAHSQLAKMRLSFAMLAHGSSNMN